MQAPKFWSDSKSLTARMLSPLGAVYSAAGWTRQAMGRPWRAPIPVICIGNLTAGGAGKTPTAITILRRLEARGITAHALTRGYGGGERGPYLVDPNDSPTRVGDEALLLAMRAPTWVSRDRVAGSRAAVAAGAQAIVMDDGFQNPSLHKDLSIVVVDAGAGFGGGRVIPAGPLREPVARGLARADAALIIGKEPFDLPIPFDKPVLRGRFFPAFSGASLTGARVVAFAGIGRPQKFFNTLRSMGAVVVETQAFPDHHRYDRRILERMIRSATMQNALLATTEKDAVKLPEDLRRQITTVVVNLRIEPADELDALLDGVMSAAR